MIATIVIVAKILETALAATGLIARQRVRAKKLERGPHLSVPHRQPRPIQQSLIG